MIEQEKSVWYVDPRMEQAPEKNAEDYEAFAQGSAQMAYCRSGLPSGTKDVKILLLGSKGVGKTALVVRFLTKRFIGDYDCTSDQVYKYKTTIGGKHATAHILDTCGDWKVGTNAEETHEEGARLETLLKWADVTLLLFSLVDLESFKKMEKCRKKIHQQLEDTQLVVVGTKSDLIDSRRIQPEILSEYSAHQKLTVHETSARESYESVLQVFQQAYKEAVTRNSRSSTNKLKTLIQSTLRSYLLRSTAEGSEKPSSAVDTTSIPEDVSDDEDYACRSRTNTL